MSKHICHHRLAEYPRIMLHLTAVNKRYTCYLLGTQYSVLHSSKQIQHPQEHRSHFAQLPAANCHLLEYALGWRETDRHCTGDSRSTGLITGMMSQRPRSHAADKQPPASHPPPGWPPVRHIPFALLTCLLFSGTFSFGGHVQTPPVTTLWHR